jgi:agmatine deiminase
VLLAWPGAQSDWAPWLDQARATVAAIAAAIAKRAKVLIITDDGDSARAGLAAAHLQTANVTVVEQPLNDTWARDYGPITVLDHGTPALLDFGFNGWGLKFRSDEDNQATRRLHAAGHLGRTRVETQGLILEGGSIESDGAGTILTTTACLLSPNRNPHLDQAGVEEALRHQLGATRIHWLHHGHLAGDDTDAHIDTIARLCPGDTIAYVRCDDPADEHYDGFAAMEAELRRLRTTKRSAYRLVPLPWPTARHAREDGHRLPATYANFLFVNGAVLVPTYGDPAKDQAALAAVATACPGFAVEGIDCSVLVEQHGSLHCMTMQIPEEVFTWTP